MRLIYYEGEIRRKIIDLIIPSRVTFYMYRMRFNRRRFKGISSYLMSSLKVKEMGLNRRRGVCLGEYVH